MTTGFRKAESEDVSTYMKPLTGPRNKSLYKSFLEGDTWCVMHWLILNRLYPIEKITNNGNTILHVAVAVSSSTKKYEFLKELLEMTPEVYTLLDLKNIDGSTLLHVAAIGGNTEAVNILVERNPELLLVKDKEGHTPLALSVSNMHNKSSKCLFE
ncbi:ankyrin repeat-containing domain, PGG domain protein, partial [Tanacetum coccineum]